jgi:hypothetical protein
MLVRSSLVAKQCSRRATAVEWTGGRDCRRWLAQAAKRHERDRRSLPMAIRQPVHPQSNNLRSFRAKPTRRRPSRPVGMVVIEKVCANPRRTSPRRGPQPRSRASRRGRSRNDPIRPVDCIWFAARCACIVRVSRQHPDPQRRSTPIGPTVSRKGFRRRAGPRRSSGRRARTIWHFRRINNLFVIQSANAGTDT